MAAPATDPMTIPAMAPPERWLEALGAAAGVPWTPYEYWMPLTATGPQTEAKLAKTVLALLAMAWEKPLAIDCVLPWVESAGKNTLTPSFTLFWSSLRELEVGMKKVTRTFAEDARYSVMVVRRLSSILASWLAASLVAGTLTLTSNVTFGCGTVLLIVVGAAATAYHSMRQL